MIEAKRYKSLQISFLSYNVLNGNMDWMSTIPLVQHQ